MIRHMEGCTGTPPTFGCDACRAAAGWIPTPSEDPGSSYSRRLTLRAQAALDAGVHPANGTPIRTDVTCGDCVHLLAVSHNRTWFKCRHHRLGASHSQASDIRVSWPGCAKFEPKQKGNR